VREKELSGLPGRFETDRVSWPSVHVQQETDGVSGTLTVPERMPPGIGSIRFVERTMARDGIHGTNSGIKKPLNRQIAMCSQIGTCHAIPPRIALPAGKRGYAACRL